MAELVDAVDSKSTSSNRVLVRVRSSAKKGRAIRSPVFRKNPPHPIRFSRKIAQTELMDHRKINHNGTLLPMSYLFNSDIYRIQEPSLDIYLEETHPQSILQEERFSSGKIASQCYFIKEILHGPSRFYSKKEILLSETWFWKGKREGIARFFYASAIPYAILRYRNGVKEGLQEYFYEDGMPRTRQSYFMGALDGESILYWPNHKLKRRSFFISGKADGLEQFWDESGTLLSENQHET